MVTDCGAGLAEFTSAVKFRVVAGTISSGREDTNRVTGILVVVGEPLGVLTVTVLVHVPAGRLAKVL